MSSVPNKWLSVHLSDVGKQRKETINPKDHGQAQFVGLEHIPSGQVTIPRTATSIDLRSSKSRFRAGDILYGKLRPYLDKGAIVDFEGICSTDIIVIEPMKNFIFPQFLAQLLHTSGFLNHAISSTTGTNHPRTTWKQVSAFSFELPPLPEQRKIVEILFTVDEAIRKTEEAIEHSERLKRGLLHNLIDGAILDHKGEMIELGSVCNQRKEIVHPNSSMVGKFVGLEHIDSGATTLSRSGEASSLKSSKFRFYPSDVLYGKLRPYLDKAVKATEIGICSTDILTLRSGDQLLPDYLVWLLHSESFIKHAVSSTTGTNHPRTSWGHISKFSFPLPSLEEQRRIATVLNTIADGCDIRRRQKQRLENIRRTMLNDLITGRVRHPDFVGRGSS